MAHLKYGIEEGGGFVVLTGEIGTGKTTLCRSLLQKLPEKIDVALVLNPQINHVELLATLCDELSIDYPPNATVKVLLDALNDYLLKTYAQGRTAVLIIDEAQLLTRSVLEQVRILTNLETTKQKLLQIILIGQPELSDTLSRVDMQQLAQRVTARYHLGPLNLEDTRVYVNYRLAVAGCRKRMFTNAALRQVFRSSGGIPRLINVICDRALLGAYSENVTEVAKSIARKAAQEVLGNAERRRAHWWRVPAMTLMLTMLLIAVAQTTFSVGDVVAQAEALYQRMMQPAQSLFSGYQKKPTQQLQFSYKQVEPGGLRIGGFGATAAADLRLSYSTESDTARLSQGARPDSDLSTLCQSDAGNYQEPSCLC